MAKSKSLRARPFFFLWRRREVVTATLMVLGLIPGSGRCQQRNYDFQPPVQAPKAQPSDSNQVLEIPVPKQLHGCWAGDLTRGRGNVGFHQHAQLCFKDRTWSFDVSHPELNLPGMEVIDSQDRRKMIGAGENWVERSAIWTYQLQQGLARIKMTSESHWRCELTADHQALWCQGSATNHLTDPQGHNLVRQVQTAVRMTREKRQ